MFLIHRKLNDCIKGSYLVITLYKTHSRGIFKRYAFSSIPKSYWQLLCNKCQVTQSVEKFSTPKELFWEQCYEVVNGTNENNFVFVRSNWILFPTRQFRYINSSFYVRRMYTILSFLILVEYVL